MDQQVRDLKEAFIGRFGGDNQELVQFFAPGRINLIGEHIDYNGGFVFPCALDFGTYAVARKRKDGQVQMASLNMEASATFTTHNLVYEKSDDWMNYPKGVLHEFITMGHTVTGFDVLYYGNIPNGAGLSSSASLEVLTAVIVNTFSSTGLDPITLVKLSQKAENQFVGVNCGIMDQFAVGMGQVDKAILLNCDTLEYHYVPLVLEGYKILIGNTKKRRGLADSKYNERRNECDRALQQLQVHRKIQHLCDLSVGDFKTLAHHIDNPTDRKRAQHAISENARVLEAVEALKQNDLKRFGILLNASHASLRDLYEVTGVELDTMVAETQKLTGVLGARMTGAGFGGCIIALVAEDQIDTVMDTVGKRYEAAVGLTPEFYVASIGSGAGIMTV